MKCSTAITNNITRLIVRPGRVICRLRSTLAQAYEPEGLGATAPPDSGKTIIFPAKAKFFGQKPTAKNEKSIVLNLLNEKTEFILLSEIKCP